ncbi:hypothetical protein EI94DRAFT_712279 [Lactarius quietus]|nr:hypothetical protein EI94DRAFT_712279 [Lactarius quietus]
MALTFPMTIEGLEDKFDIIPGAHLHIFWKYHEAVRINLRLDIQVFRMHRAHGMLAGQTCQNPNGSSIPAWLDSYITSIGEDPALFNLSEFHMHLTCHLLSSGCASCRNMTTEMIYAFWKALTTVVDNGMTNGKQDLLLGGEEKLQSHPNLRGSVSPGPGNGYFKLDLPHADVIIQSSDLINFHVNTVVLSVSSPFF